MSGLSVGPPVLEVEGAGATQTGFASQLCHSLAVAGLRFLSGPWGHLLWLLCDLVDTVTSMLPGV